MDNNLEEIKVKINKYSDIVDAVSKVRDRPTLMKLIKDGFDMIDKRRIYAEQLEEVGLTDLNVDNMKALGVDRLIEISLGGKRKGNRITWELDGKTYYCDPFTMDLVDD